MRHLGSRIALEIREFPNPQVPRCLYHRFYPSSQPGLWCVVPDASRHICRDGDNLEPLLIENIKNTVQELRLPQLARAIARQSV